MVAVFAFIVLAAAIAVIMSLERVLGRPIPKLRDSLCDAIAHLLSYRSQ